LQNSTADDSSSGCGLDCIFDMSKHDVPVGLDQWPITFLGNGESRSIGAIVGDTAGGSEFRRRSGSEVELLIRLSECGVRRASCLLLANGSIMAKS
jgi:hypothetical protein